MGTRSSVPAATAALAWPGIDPQNPPLTIVEPAPKAPGRRRWLGSRGRALGDGTAWLVFDAGGDFHQYQCYWYGGSCGDHLLEHTRAATAADAVRWATARTARVRIRLSDLRTYWAGTGPSPGGFAGTWAPDRPERHLPVDVPRAQELGCGQPGPFPSRIGETVGART